MRPRGRLAETSPDPTLEPRRPERPTHAVSDESTSPAAPAPAPAPEKAAPTPVPMAVDSEAPVRSPAPKKPKKKKQSYKNLMAQMTKASPQDDKAKSEEERARRCLGGGQFSKIDKI